MRGYITIRMIGVIMDGWNKVARHLTEFNGLKYDRRNLDNTGDIGIFKELHSLMGCGWSVRKRRDGDSWDWGIHLSSMKACREHAEKYFLKVKESACKD